ncbi:MAG: ThuA domain-containing protein [Alphaproteobacteria bacterium]|nr:ThuA domain-containing protein [Alphaproteobacteria bacterium]
MRWMQVAFTEDNPIDYDPQFWFDLFKRTHADGVCLSAGGSFAFYPSKVPLHHRAKYLGDHDIYGDMSKGCRALGMNIIARVDPHALSPEAFAVHHDWCAYTEDGKPRRHWAAPDLYVTCQNGGFMFDFMPKVLKEITTLYAPDGFFGNRWAGSGMCWCNVCRTKFRAATGFDLPRSDEHDDAVTRAYDEWDKQMRWAQYTLWNDTVKAVKPDGFFCPNGHMSDPRAFIPLVAIDRQGRSGLTPPWMNGKYAKQARSVSGDRPVAGLFNVGYEEPYRWKDSVQASPEIESWVHSGMAQGFRPWMCKFDAKVIDPRWVPVVEKIYEWHWRHDKYFRDTENLARVALVNSSHTYADDLRQKVADAQNGYYQALVESRIPFEMADDRLLDPEHLSRYRVLVLPNIAVLSDAQCAQLRAYVKAGGRIVATGETSLHDETGKRRANFGLADLFGCDFAGKIDEPVHNSYLTPYPPHPLVRGLENAPRIIATVEQIHVTPTDKAPQPLTLIPSYPDLPMERVYTFVTKSDIPMVFCREVGKGRVVYFPMDLARTFWEVLSGDHLLLLRNAVEWAADEPQPLNVTGPGLVDVAYWRQKESLAVHLVNMTNPMTMKGPYREILPAGPYVVTMTLPPGVKPASVTLLESSQPAKYRRDGDRLIVEVPRIAVHEIVAVDLV